MSDAISLSRRQSLVLIVKGMLLIVVLAFVWVMFANLSVTDNSGDRDNKIADYFVRVDLASLKVGQLRKVTLRYREVWIYHRSKADITQLKQQADSLRSVDNNYFVFFPYEPRRNCQLNWQQGSKVFYDPCNAKNYDLAGRLVNNSKLSEQRSLRLPKYQYSAPGQLLIDARK